MVTLLTAIDIIIVNILRSVTAVDPLVRAISTVQHAVANAIPGNALPDVASDTIAGGFSSRLHLLFCDTAVMKLESKRPDSVLLSQMRIRNDSRFERTKPFESTQTTMMTTTLT